MVIRLARIDDRLIHGQVATAWTKMTNINRIIVVSDEVAKDPFRTVLLKEAAPPGIRANVVTIEKMLQIRDYSLYSEQAILLLFTNPQDVVRVVQGGLSLSSVNIGGMRFQTGKHMLTNYVSIDEKDRQAFYYLYYRGIELELRKVPTDRKISLIDLLEKEKK
ncbi:mannose/fructose/sorbose PTS transporter subunit IIB [Enterococcus bulliens]|uniref:mannose/fructose/sorbose PTS transporter subunit IIB n=1 Tax=uncultured Enterococcus sp. TaxID=167972 RepID=UPI0025F2AB98|nr:mannose/fructose/sorbose PTS transporter subunit IIB [uncultured Enterococcus sp.]